MVDVEQHALRALEQDALAPCPRLVEVAPHRLGEGQDESGDLAQIGQQALAIDRRLAEPGAQRVMVRAQPVELRPQVVEMRQIAHADRAATDLVLVRRTDTAPRRTDLARAARILAQTVEVAVDGEDQRTIVGDLQRLRRGMNALLAETLDLGLQSPGSRTTPLPMTLGVPRTMPEGSNDSL